MKKNWTLRAGAMLLALVLMTSCFVGGTFAKYVTKKDGTNSTARVAKWGVTITGTGETFANTYASDTAGYTKNTVVSDVKVVAPGTSGNLAQFTVAGTPEVAGKVSYKVDELTFTGWTDKDSAYYCPIVITVGATQYKGSDYTSLTDFANAVKAAIEALEVTFDANQAIPAAASNLNVSWSWAFSTGDANDVKDTYLGDQAAADNASTISIKVSAIATQID